MNLKNQRLKILGESLDSKVISKTNKKLFTDFIFSFNDDESLFLSQNISYDSLKSCLNLFINIVSLINKAVKDQDESLLTQVNSILTLIDQSYKKVENLVKQNRLVLLEAKVDNYNKEVEKQDDEMLFNEKSIDNLKEARMFFKPEIHSLLKKVPDEMGYLGLVAFIHAYLEDINEHGKAKQFMKLADKYLIDLDSMNENIQLNTINENKQLNTMKSFMKGIIKDTKKALELYSDSEYFKKKLDFYTDLSNKLNSDSNPDLLMYLDKINSFNKP